MPETATPSTTDRLLTSDAEAMADLSKVEQEYKAKGQEISGYYKDAADEANRIMGLQKQGVEDLEAKGADLRKQAGALPKAPTAAPEPDVPSRQLRPFGDLGQNPSTVQLLNGTLMQLGLLAQMGMGMAKGFPQGALTAYSGALEGWAKGDAVRAENMWKEYVASVAKMDREYRRQRQEYQDIIEKYGISQDLLKTEAQLFGIRQGWQDKMISLAGRKPEEALKMFQVLEKPLTEVRGNVFKLKAEMIKAQLAEERQRAVMDHQKEIERHNRVIESQGQERLGKAMGAASKKELGVQQSLATMNDALSRMIELAPRLAQKGYLPSDPGRISLTRAQATRFMKPGDDDWQKWSTLQGNLIGFERTVANDIGPRAMQAFSAIKNFSDNPPPQSAVLGVLTQFKEMVDLARKARQGQSISPAGSDYDVTYDPSTGEFVPK